MSNHYEDVQSSKKSMLWKYFLYNKVEQKSKCNVCKCILKAGGGSTKNLLDHLKKKHQILPKKPADGDETQNGGATAPKVGRIQKYFGKRESLGEYLCHLICVDGLNFNQISTSERLRAAFKADGYNVPKSAHTLTDIFFAEFERLKAIAITEIEELKMGGYRFTISLDESTSVRNRRYLNNIYLHSKDKFQSLGMVSRIHGSMNSEKAVQRVQKIKTFRV